MYSHFAIGEKPWEKYQGKYQGKARGKSGAEDRASKFGAENVFNNVILNSTMNATMNLTNSDKGSKQNYFFSSGYLLLWIFLAYIYTKRPKNFGLYGHTAIKALYSWSVFVSDTLKLKF